MTENLLTGKEYEVSRLCLFLFDSWCERRSIVPLAYLMHAWPVLIMDQSGVGRLVSVLRELQAFHPDALTQDERVAIEDVMSISVELDL
ncbi:hypothetical protein [Paraburkholderia sp.]|jgi:hypothetical protein|uniref:hypothetical protein n=1 Tax=Paraburkholderia sp. TaxID=1926495 RepID=UPI002F407409